jgi:predicted nucleic acid-binding protein
MRIPRVYFDTSVFIGLIDNVKDRRPIAENIVAYEASHGSEIHTSIQTVNEFIQRTFDLYHAHPDIEDKVRETIASIRNVAKIQGYNEDIATEAARLMSVWGRHRKTLGESPRDKKFRWDAIHLATANLIKVDRIYAWDNPWNDFPRSELTGIKDIISPAQAPKVWKQETLFSDETPDP